MFYSPAEGVTEVDVLWATEGTKTEKRETVNGKTDNRLTERSAVDFFDHFRGAEPF